MKIEKLESKTDTKRFLVEQGDEMFLVYIPGAFNALDKKCYKLQDISGFKKGMEIILACMKED